MSNLLTTIRKTLAMLFVLSLSIFLPVGCEGGGGDELLGNVLDILPGVADATSDSWSAIAADYRGERQSSYLVGGRSSKDEAEREVLNRCRRNHGANACQIVVAGFKDGCAVVTKTRRRNPLSGDLINTTWTYHFHSPSTSESASIKAEGLEYCREQERERTRESMRREGGRQPARGNPEGCYIPRGDGGDEFLVCS